MDKVIEAIAEEMWQEENLRIHNKRRSVPWSEAATGDHERYRDLAKAALRVIKEMRRGAA